MIMLVGGFINMNLDQVNAKVFILLSMMLSVSACNDSMRPELHGFNFLQDSHTAMDSTGACLSMQHLRLTGANSVILVPFMEQSSPQSTQVTQSDAVTDVQLIAALQLAKQHQLHRVIKPQILISDSWAGAISQDNNEQEAAWFESYTQQLLHYASIAEKYQVDAFVIGTELKNLQKSEYWPTLIKQVRSIYAGKLTYAASGIVGIETFPYWNLLDHIGVTLYPDMSKNKGNEKPEKLITDTLVNQLQEQVKKSDRSVWILEVGMPSAEGWEAHPWDWRSLTKSSPSPDTHSQAKVIQQWLTSSAKKGIEGIWIWQWNSSPQAGGKDDIGYTVQNKLAQAVVHQHWQSPFNLFSRKISECVG